MKKLLLLISVYSSIMTMSPDEAIKQIEQITPRQLEEGHGRSNSLHHHLSITIDRDTPPDTPVGPEPEMPPNRLKYKLAIIAAVSALISAGLTVTVTILTSKSCP